MPAQRKILALSGGVGGAKLALGLARLLEPQQLTIVANTGDDFEHFGLHIAPDLDTLMYTLAGCNNRESGWGLADESWNCRAALTALGGADWFQLGDRDLATHLQRSQRLARGASLSAVTAELCTALGVAQQLLPMSDDPVRTIVHCSAGQLAFQHYFVREQCRPRVSGFHFDGAEQARPQAHFMALLRDPALAAIVICPSNPFVSIDPILALPGVSAALRNSRAPVLAVSPIVGGAAIKGPSAKMLRELQLPVRADVVAAHYRGLADYFVLDRVDAKLTAAIEALDMRAAVTATVMKTLPDRIALARFCLSLLEQH